jgi:hypothetical protein
LEVRPQNPPTPVHHPCRLTLSQQSIDDTPSIDGTPSMDVTPSIDGTPSTVIPPLNPQSYNPVPTWVSWVGASAAPTWWGTFKRWLPQQGRYNLKEYIWLYMWFQEKKLNGEDPFWVLVELVKYNNNKITPSKDNREPKRRICHRSRPLQCKGRRSVPEGGRGRGGE